MSITESYMNNWKPVLKESGKPRYIEIADLISQDLKRGLLMPGDRLPPQRKLAATLNVDFTTVSRAYKEALKRGLIESHVGRGTFIAGIDKASTYKEPRRDGEVDYAMNMAPEPEDPALIARMQAGLSAISNDLLPLLRYQNSSGADLDKEAAASWLSLRGMVPSLERLFITPGAHPAMTAILNMIAQKDDVILCEQITYPGIRSIARCLGINLVGVNGDDDGIMPDRLEKMIIEYKPKALYLNPTLHNPTTLTIPTKRRLEISSILNKYGLPLIEDDAYGFIPQNAPPPLATTAPELTWHIGGLAKCVGAGLRLAYVIAPTTRQALDFKVRMQAITIMISPLTLALVTRWIQDGTADHIRRFIRSETNARQKIAQKVLAGHTFKGAENAFNIWLKLPKTMTRASLVDFMANKKIGIVPSDLFTVDTAPKDYVRVCLGGPQNRTELEANLEILAHYMEQGFA